MKKRKMEACMPIENEEELEKYELDVENINVSIADGVIIGGDEEEVKMLFYYQKPIQTQCKGVIEVRTTKTRFREIAHDVNEMIQELKGNEQGYDPMFR